MQRLTTCSLEAPSLSSWISCPSRNATGRIRRGFHMRNSFGPFCCHSSLIGDLAYESAIKRAFVQGCLEEFRPGTVLDVGCNRGYHSAMAARNGAQVVAIDYDPVVVGATWRMAQNENLEILPLVVDLTRPSPATGWR